MKQILISCFQRCCAFFSRGSERVGILIPGWVWGSNEKKNLSRLAAARYDPLQHCRFNFYPGSNEAHFAVLLCHFVIIMSLAHGFILTTRRFRRRCAITWLAGRTVGIFSKQLAFRYSWVLARTGPTPPFWVRPGTTTRWSRLPAIAARLAATRGRTEISRWRSFLCYHCIQSSTSTYTITKLVTDRIRQHSKSSYLGQRWKRFISRLHADYT